MPKGKLNQVIAVVAGKKSRAQRLLTDSHHGWNKEAIAGITKTYEPLDADGDQYPAESKQIFLNVPDKVQEMADQIASFFDVVMTQEQGNTKARGDIDIREFGVSEGKPFLTDVPVTTLLFLEKQLVDLYTFASNLPTLPKDREWKLDNNRNCYVTEPIQSIKTGKRAKVIIKYGATKEHPAQTELFSEDMTLGTWTTTYMSSAIPSRQKADILRRIEEMQDAVKRAREQANSLEVDQVRYGRRILQHLFGDLLKSNEG